MKQNIVRRARNKSLRSLLKTSIKKVTLAVKEGKKDEATKFLTEAYSVIDTADKKNIIHANNAARKKSFLARSVATLEKK